MGIISNTTDWCGLPNLSNVPVRYGRALADSGYTAWGKLPGMVKVDGQHEYDTTEPRKPSHWIAMSGIPGYLPDYCQAYETRQDAIDGLIWLWDVGDDEYNPSLTADEIAELTADGILYRDATDEQPFILWTVLQVVECDCNNPEQHED